MFLKTTNNKNIEIKRAESLKRILVIPLAFFLVAVKVCFI